MQSISGSGRRWNRSRQGAVNGLKRRVNGLNGCNGLTRRGQRIERMQRMNSGLSTVGGFCQECISLLMPRKPRLARSPLCSDKLPHSCRRQARRCGMCPPAGSINRKSSVQSVDAGLSLRPYRTLKVRIQLSAGLILRQAQDVSINQTPTKCMVACIFLAT
jgi:hypothetical protein